MWIKLTGRAARRSALAIGTAALPLVGAAAAVGVNPARFGVSTTPVVLHLLSFRGLVALGAFGAATTAFGSAALGTSRSFPGRRLALGSILLTAGIGQVVAVGRRGWNAPTSADRADLVVVTANTLGGAATPAQVAAVVVAELNSADAAVVSLPESPESFALQTAELLAVAGRGFQIFSVCVGPRPLDSTSLLVDDKLGRYQQLPGPDLLLGVALARPVSGSGPSLAAVHAGAPTPSVGYARWRGDVDKVVALCREHPDSIVAGDFNATLDHAMLRDLAPAFDAAAAAGAGAEGTWPARLPLLLAAPIDHVLINGDYAVLDTRAIRVGHSDHRAVIARLIRRRPEPAPASTGQQGVDRRGPAES